MSKPGTLGELSDKLASISIAVSASYLPWEDLELELTGPELRSTDAALAHVRAVVIAVRARRETRTR